MWEYADKFLYAAIGVFGATFATWLLSKMPVAKSWRPDEQTVRISIVSSAVAVFTTLFFITMHDRGLLPLEQKRVINREMHSFGQNIPNKSGHPILVTISAVHKAVLGPAQGDSIVGNTMCAAVSDDPANLQSHRAINCSSKFTVAVQSFNVGNRHTSMTFVVPKDEWYHVTTDGGPSEPSFWTETPL